MSLKAFHIAFIALSSLLCFGVAAWSVLQTSGGAGGGYIAAAIASTLLGIALIVYGIRFLRKLRHLSFL